MSTSVLILITFLFLAFAYLAQSFTAKHDLAEPPVVHPKIPIVGHVIGLLRDGAAYWAQLSAQHPDLPIFSISVVFSKIYVMNSPAMVNAVQRYQRKLSFAPFMASSTVRTLGFEGAAAARLLEDPDEGNGYFTRVTETMHESLLGHGLDRMNETVLRRFKPFVDELGADRSEPFDLYAWCRHAVTQAATHAVFGPKNPFAAPEVEHAFWTFERGVLPLFLNVLPGITARKAHRARDTMVRAFEAYIDSAGPEDASELAYARWKCQRDAGVPPRDIARLETGMPFGLLANWVPVTFWMLFDVYSRPQLLEELREEVRDNALVVDEEEGDGRKHVIDLGLLRDRCPLLLATLQELLRLRNIAAPIRMGKTDVLLGDRYKIKAGSIIQLPGPALARIKEVWGEGAAEFDPGRFVKGQGQKDSGKKTTSYLAFGTTPNMCPGRHFATGGVLAVTAMVLLRFDIIPEQGGWKEPRGDWMALLASVNCPANEFKVRVKTRPEWKGVEWDFRASPGKGKFGLITG